MSVSLLWINQAPLKDAALAYAMRGWPVLPLNEKEKRPLVDKELEGPDGEPLFHGLKQATTDLATIERWWDAHPNANIGLRTGIVFDVLDLDGPPATAAMVKVAPRYRHDGPVSSTGKGYHLLFAASGSKNHAFLMDTTVDFRGDNGYIVAPPSIHPSGHRYKWARDSNNLPEPPEWLRPLIFPPKIERTTDPNDPSVLEALQKSPDIVDLFNVISNGEMWKIGRLWKVHCPFHQDDTASLMIYPETNSFRCFGCHAWGDPLNVRRWMKTGRLRRGDKRLGRTVPLSGVNDVA